MKEQNSRFHGWKGKLLLLLGSGVVAFVLLEAGVMLLIKKGYISTKSPTYSFMNVMFRKAGFWYDVNPDFGVWHKQNVEYRHTTERFDVVYRTNSYGARDIERPVHSDKARIIVLGDSFTEGYGVARESRLTDVLQERTGIPHLNFGTAGYFGPTQYYLMYKTLAGDFSHSAVMIGILPANDFADDDYEYGVQAHSGRYRPYLRGQYPDYELVYFRENLPESTWYDSGSWLNLPRGLLREFTYTYNGLSFVRGRLRWQRAVKSNPFDRSGDRDFSGFYDFTDEQFYRMKYCLEKIIELAGTRPVCIYTIPAHRDFLRYEGVGHPPLADRLSELTGQENHYFVDLLPKMFSAGGPFTRFHLGDHGGGHWNECGNRVGAEIILESVPEFFESLRPDPATGRKKS